MRLLIVEDDQMIGQGLQQALKSEGYAVDWVQDGLSGGEAAVTVDYDLLVLDLGLPGQSGLSLLKQLRQKKKDLPVLILTARDTVQDRVEGLDAGADDYLMKPFSLQELEARVRALLRRRGGRADPIIQCGPLELNSVTKELSRSGVRAQLSAREYALMEALMERPGAVLSRPQLEEKLYGWNEEVGSNAVEVHVHQLRKKFGKDIIRNIRGMGYMAENA